MSSVRAKLSTMSSSVRASDRSTNQTPRRAPAFEKAAGHLDEMARLAHAAEPGTRHQPRALVVERLELLQVHRGGRCTAPWQHHVGVGARFNLRLGPEQSSHSRRENFAARVVSFSAPARPCASHLGLVERARLGAGLLVVVLLLRRRRASRPARWRVAERALSQRPTWSSRPSVASIDQVLERGLKLRAVGVAALGVFLRAWSTVFELGGHVGPIDDGPGTWHSIHRTQTSASDACRTAGRWVSSSQSTMPSENRSLRASSSLPSSCSGER